MRFRNAVGAHASALDSNQPVTRWGTVQSVNTADMTAKVLIQPDGVLSGWLPILSPFGGPGWGLLCPPVAGQQVKLIPDAGDHESYEIHGMTWSSAGLPPPGSAAGELWLVHASGAAVKLLNTGHVLLSDPSGSAVEFQNNGSLAVTAGTMAVTGNITLAGNLIVTGKIIVNGTTMTVP
jgi:phage baseplate assembly protein V